MRSKKRLLLAMFLFALFTAILKGQENKFLLEAVYWLKGTVAWKKEQPKVVLEWILPDSYKALEKGEIQIYRSSNGKDYKLLKKGLSLRTFRFEDKHVQKGDIWFYQVRTVVGKNVSKKVAKVYLPPRGVDPRKNGLLFQYNQKLLKKALEMGYLEKKEASPWKKWIQEHPHRSLASKWLKEQIVDSGILRKLEKGKVVYWQEKEKWKKRFIQGAGPAPRIPFGKVKKVKSSTSPFPKLMIQLFWTPSPDEDRSVEKYRIERSIDGKEFFIAGEVEKGTTSFKDEGSKKHPLIAGKSYYYRIVTVGKGGETFTSLDKPILLALPWFAFNKIYVLAFVLLFSLIFGYFIWEGKKGKALKLRRIEGLNAIEEAIGRATEMGKPVLYVPGIDDIQELQTVASLIILSHVSEVTARYRTPIIVPCRDSVVMTMAEEVVRESAYAANRPDTFNSDNIRYLSTDQFAYVAGVDGIMLREKPAANLYLGSFFAESLILAETGYESGAIQVAGTANYHQLPFFIVACDFTIIGEEFYAASAYLSKDPQIIASIKGADYFKIVIILFIIALTVAAVVSSEALEFAKTLI
ncbi:MAG: fibronectin type III domain-containing protein [Planctomycetota bacterium]|nr:MAG: fibronectin type III domain-containing protein [Planctomycetota bacterium]